MSFLTHFSVINDPRHEINKKHDLLDILFLTASAVMSGAQGWKDIHAFGEAKLTWLRQYRAFEAGIPVDDTIARVISALDPTHFTQCFVAWVNELRTQKGGEHIAIDGKTLRRSFSGERSTALHSITAWSKTNGLVLAQRKSAGKKNEHQSVLAMLDILELKHSVVTLDAMNTQKKIAKKINAKGGDYVLCVKDNHPTLHREIKDYFAKMKKDCPAQLMTHYHEETDAGHGRIEIRRCRQLRVNKDVSEAEHWAGIATLVEVERERHINEKRQQETQYYISSLALNAAAVAEAIRGHWEVENKVHWVLDVTFREDDSRLRRDNAAENIAVMRRFALNLARLHPRKNSMKGKLKQAMWSDDFRSELLLGKHLDTV